MKIQFYVKFVIKNVLLTIKNILNYFKQFIKRNSFNFSNSK